MRKTLLSLLLVNLFSNPVLAAGEVGDLAADKLDAYRAAVKAFGSDLKAELQAGIKSGGPVAAVGICNTKAAEIADKHAKKDHWKVSRVSLKNRNLKNVPDEWEKGVLAQFEQRKAAGEDMLKMEYGRIVEAADGSRELRYMKAIPTAEACLTCHGTEIKPEVAARIDELYPADLAKGYKLGDLRGAFSVREALK